MIAAMWTTRGRGSCCVASSNSNSMPRGKIEGKCKMEESFPSIFRTFDAERRTGQKPRNPQTKPNQTTITPQPLLFLFTFRLCFFLFCLSKSLFIYLQRVSIFMTDDLAVRIQSFERPVRFESPSSIFLD